MTSSDRTTHSKKQFMGHALIASVFLFFVVVSLLLGETEFLAFLIVLAVIATAVAYVVWKFDALWARIVGLVAAILTLLSSFFFIFGIFQPFSPLEFVTGLAFTIGIILAIVGGIMALVAGRTGKMGDTTRDSQLTRTVLVVLGVATVFSIVGLFATKSTVSDEAAAGAVEIVMKDSEFDPASATVPAGSKLLVKNSDFFTHDFALDAFDIKVTIGPGSEKLIELPATASGPYDYYCSLHSSEDDGVRDGMIGDISVGS